MITIHVKVILPSEEVRDFDLPLNTAIDQLYARLVTYEDLPTTTSRGEPINYGFYHRRTGQYLPTNSSLVNAGVEAGDTLDVMPWPTARPPVQAQEHAHFYQVLPYRTPRRLLGFAVAVLLIVIVVVAVILLVGGSGGDDSTATTLPSITLTRTGDDAATVAITGDAATETPPLEGRTRPATTPAPATGLPAP